MRAKVLNKNGGNAMIDRRDVLKLALGSAAALASPALAQPAKPRTRIVFLGTKGGPRVDSAHPIPPISSW